MESEGGFGALILVYAVLMQRVATTTRARIVEWLTEIVAIQKPVKAAARGPVPARIPSQRVRFHASGNHGVGFQWLLIEMGALTAAGPKAIAANRREMPPFSRLLLHQPAERLQPDVDNVTSGSPVPAKDHRLGKFRVIVGHYRLKPHPIIRRIFSEQVDQAVG